MIQEPVSLKYVFPGLQVLAMFLAAIAVDLYGVPYNDLHGIQYNDLYGFRINLTVISFDSV